MSTEAGHFPVVAIVGRPNVGKSALFNRIARRQISLVFDKPGVTRDRIAADCQWEEMPFTLVDTGGIGLDDESGFEKAIQREVEISIETATDILLVVDGREGLQVLDTETARRLRKAHRRVLLVVNKIDSTKQTHLDAEFTRLGLGEPLPVSAAHGRGIDRLMQKLTASWEIERSEQQTVAEKTKPVRVAVIGRPNAGKSSLINALLKQQRLIVSELPGTTRDAVDIQFRHGDKNYCFIDTAGMRKRRKIIDPLESAMTGRTAHAINRADVCVLVIDAAVGVGEQEKKIAGLIQKAEKPCVILVNKWDLAKNAEKKTAGKKKKGKKPENFRQQYEQAAKRELFFLNYASVVFLSAKENKNLGEWLRELGKIEKNRQTRISTGILNRILQRATEQQPPPRKGKGRKIFKIYYATQIPGRTSVPTITAFVNNPRLLTDAYQRYLEQQIRREYPCAGCPIKWVLRERKEKSKR